MADDGAFRHGHPGDLGREYWEVVGGTPNGWSAAHAGLVRARRPTTPRTAG